MRVGDLLRTVLFVFVCVPLQHKSELGSSASVVRIVCEVRSQFCDRMHFHTPMPMRYIFYTPAYHACLFNSERCPDPHSSYSWVMVTLHEQSCHPADPIAPIAGSMGCCFRCPTAKHS